MTTEYELSIKFLCFQVETEHEVWEFTCVEESVYKIMIWI